MNKGWMIRAGRGGKFINDFEADGYAAVGWNKMGALDQYKTADALKENYLKTYGNEKPQKTANALAMIRKFVSDIHQDDWVVSYNPKQRRYLIGRDLGEFQFVAHQEEYGQRRKVTWVGQVSRDSLSDATQRSLSSTLTLFSLKSSVLAELLDHMQEYSTNE